MDREEWKTTILESVVISSLRIPRWEHFGSYKHAAETDGKTETARKRIYGWFTVNFFINDLREIL